MATTFRDEDGAIGVSLLEYRKNSRSCSKGETDSDGHEKMVGMGGRNVPLTGSDGKISVRPATPHRETAAKMCVSTLHIDFISSPG